MYNLCLSACQRGSRRYKYFVGRKIIRFFFFFIYATQDLKAIMDSAPHGVVYFSLGSNVKSSQMPTETVSMLLATFATIKETVLWKWESDQLPDLPINVIVRKWFPQNDILGKSATAVYSIRRFRCSRKFFKMEIHRKCKIKYSYVNYLLYI